jgi:DNA modification methylase
LEETVEEYIRHLSIVTAQILRSLRPTGSLWLNLGDSYHNKEAALVPERMAIALSEQGYTVRGVIIWDKGGRKPVADRPALTTESIIVAVKARGRGPYYYDKSAPYSQDKIWRISGTGRRGHNAGYNLELPKRCITIGCPPGGLVLDPFAGSGTTAEAAGLLGRQSIGIELVDYSPL